MISLASGYGNFTPPAAAVAAATTSLQSGVLPVSPIAGLPALREALAARYPNSSVAPEQIVLTAGTKAALFALLKAVLRPGDEVLLPTPNWFGFWQLIEQAGGVVRPLALAADDDYALTPAALQAAITPRTRVLLLSNPNNPTGRVYHRAELDAVLAVTRQHPGLFVLSDEIYNLITFGAEPVPSLLEWDDPHGQHLVVNGFSKSLALIGWGVGYLVAPAHVAQACAAWQFATATAVPIPTQLAALAATEAAPTIAHNLLTQLAPNRAILLDGLATLPNVRCSHPEATYYAFPDFTAYLDPQKSPEVASAAFVSRLQAAGVAVVDGASCGAPGFARLSYAVPAADLREAFRRLHRTLAAS
ncbi:pyridoxal phosphate-dependent aminotransferase [Hymenobacter cavernae]|uniref:Aminotransferase n=1 Tax=Hymenobacter cavernae TaxID=2044852 RepID=A0ABQ1URW9_9BACT|nr:aminotransferase class I/II-fold pyridoxal phosphate-dependent enzyme [Hymenobacter cavernae]GGF23730.1 aminotransferase [Hymenobacter cavernae]